MSTYTRENTEISVDIDGLGRQQRAEAGGMTIALEQWRAGLDTAEAGPLLERAVTFSAARLIQTAYEMSDGSERLSAHSVILLQIGANLLDDPRAGQVELYGIPHGAPGR